MREIERGHVYGLATHEGKEVIFTFLKSLPEGDPANHDGTLCQEVIRMLIKRVLDLNSQVPCHENIDLIVKLRECLILFEQRAFRNTLNKSYAKSGQHVEDIPTLGNGHVFALSSRNIAPAL